MGPDSLYCGKWRTISKLRHDLDLGSAMPNIELVRDIFIYYDVSRKNTGTQKHGNMETDSDEYSLVAFCKNATIIICF